MLLKLKIATTKHPAPANHSWSTIVAYLRDRRILSHMNEHNLRDIGLNRSSYKPVDRAR